MQENKSLDIPFWENVYQALDMKTHGISLSSFTASPWKHLRQLGKRVPTQTLQDFPLKTFNRWNEKIIH